jgi:hypothetical protein
MLAFFKLFVSFSEEDLLGKITTGLYSEGYKGKKLYTPSNESFQFVSIYPRIRGFKILLRIIANLLFLFFFEKLSVKAEILAK